MCSSVYRHRGSFNASGVTATASAIHLRVAVQDLRPETSPRDSYVIYAPWNSGEIADDKSHFIIIPAFSDKTYYALFPVMKAYPLKPVCRKIQFVQCRFRPVKMIQVFNPLLHPPVKRVFKSVPFQAFFMAPLFPLREFTSHEQELLSGVSIHVSEHEPEVGVSLPFAARHLPYKRTFTMNDFIVGQRKKEILCKCIPYTECKLTVMRFPVNRVF